MILLTLTRKAEVRLARWEHINLERAEREIPPEHSKTGAGQIVYLSRQAVRILEQLRPSARRAGYIFPAVGSDGNTPIGQSTLNRTLVRVQHGMKHFTVHDLRRTGATRLSEMGFQPDWIEKALNHKLRGVRGIYNRAEYATQRPGYAASLGGCFGFCPSGGSGSLRDMDSAPDCDRRTGRSATSPRGSFPDRARYG